MYKPKPLEEDFGEDAKSQYPEIDQPSIMNKPIPPVPILGKIRSHIEEIQCRETPSNVIFDQTRSKLE